jgi:ABC-type Fe3+ transport system substrate-binding protein
MGLGKFWPLAILMVVLAHLPSSAQPYRLVLYYDGPPRLIDEMEKAFESYRGDVLEVRDLEKGAAGEAKDADIFWGVCEPAATQELQAEHLHAYRSSQLGTRSPALQAEALTSSNAEYMVIVYNNGRVGPDAAPAGWDDLHERRWQHRLAFADPAVDPHLFAAMAALVMNRGWDYMGSLTTEAILTASSAEAADLVVGQGADIAILPYFEAKARVDDGQPLAIVWPTEGTIRALRTIGILRRDRRPHMMTGLAEQFVDFVLSSQGQWLASQYGLVPVRADVPAPPIPPEGVVAWSVDSGWLAANHEELRRRFAELAGSD